MFLNSTGHNRPREEDHEKDCRGSRIRIARFHGVRTNCDAIGSRQSAIEGKQRKKRSAGYCKQEEGRSSERRRQGSGVRERRQGFGAGRRRQEGGEDGKGNDAKGSV